MRFFAKTLRLPEKVAKEELSRARKFCREDFSDNDGSAWCDEIDDSSDVSGLHGSRATSPTIMKSSDPKLSLFQSLPIFGEIHAGRLPLGFGDSKLDPSLPGLLSGTQTSSHHKLSKKRDLEQVDADDHEAKQTVTKHGRSRHAKKAKLQASDAGNCDQVIITSHASTSSAKKPNSATEIEVPKPRKSRKRRKNGAKEQHPGEITNQKDLEVAKTSEDFPNNILTVRPEKHLNVDSSRSSEKAEPGPEKPSDKAADFFTDEGSDHLSQDPRLNGTQQPPGIDEIFKSQRKVAKKARRRAAWKANRKANPVKEERKAKPPESKLSLDEKNIQAITISETEQDPHSPQDFHSPMIQSV